MNAKAASDDAVFVFAQAAERLRMALVVLPSQAGNVPLNVRFDACMAMSAAGGLSAHGKVAAGARVTMFGRALAQTGALQGNLTLVAPGAQNLEIGTSENISN